MLQPVSVENQFDEVITYPLPAEYNERVRINENYFVKFCVLYLMTMLREDATMATRIKVMEH